MIISGSSHPKLAKSIALALKRPVAEVEISKFPNGEKRVWVKTPLKGKSVVIVQSFSEPVDEHIIEFCLLSDAAIHTGAKKIIGVVPWFGYSPQDKLFRSGEPISAHVVARIIANVGVDHLVVADIHSPEALKNFPLPVSEVTSIPVFVDHFRRQNLQNYIAVALDRGATQRASEFAQKLKLPLAQFEKFRDRSTGQVAFKALHGKDEINHKHAISFDDFVSTGSTRIQAAAILKQSGALSYTDCITHALLTGDSPARLQASHIDALIATDSYPIPLEKYFPKLTVLPLAPTLAKAVAPLL